MAGFRTASRLGVLMLVITMATAQKLVFKSYKELNKEINVDVKVVTF